MLTWFALYVKARHEKVVGTILRMKGFEICLPMVRSRRKWIDRDKLLDLPAFPGYLFCQFDLENRTPIASTSRIVSVVGAGKNPIAIPPEEIGRVMSGVEAAELILRVVQNRGRPRAPSRDQKAAWRRE